MKLSTRSRYGTRLMLDMAQHYGQGPIQLGEIARRQNISLKYLEQIIRPLKKAGYVKSFRGARGGHMLNGSPADITVGEIVSLLEGGKSLVICDQDPQSCDRVSICLTRHLWRETARSVFERLSTISFADLLAMRDDVCKLSSPSTAGGGPRTSK